MLDLVTSFDWRGERRHLLMDYSALWALEKDHGFELVSAWQKIEKGSVIATASVLLCGLEAHRKKGSPAGPLGDRLRWTIEDAQAIVADLSPLVAIRLAADAIAKCSAPKPANAETSAEGKAEAGSNGPPSS